jgi:hypothetical protein
MIMTVQGLHRLKDCAIQARATPSPTDGSKNDYKRPLIPATYFVVHRSLRAYFAAFANALLVLRVYVGACYGSGLLLDPMNPCPSFIFVL